MTPTRSKAFAELFAPLPANNKCDTYRIRVRKSVSESASDYRETLETQKSSASISVLKDMDTDWKESRFLRGELLIEIFYNWKRLHVYLKQ